VKDLALAESSTSSASGDKIDEIVIANLIAIRDVVCRICKKRFVSNNKLHLHLQAATCGKTATDLPATEPVTHAHAGTVEPKISITAVFSSTASALKGDSFAFPG
jgi:capsular polysaccharide biosynthesis protein